MTEIVTTVTNIKTLAAQIRTEHLAVKEAARSGLAHAMKCGDLLIEAKAKVKHGDWLGWLKNECSISERMSQHYMKLAKHRREVERKSEMISDLTLTEAIKMVGQKEDHACSAAFRRADASKHATSPQLSKPKPESDAKKDEEDFVAPSEAFNPQAATYAPTPGLQSVMDVAATSTADDIKRDFDTLQAAAVIVARAAKLNAEKKKDTDAALAERQVEQELYYLNELWALFGTMLELAHPRVESAFIDLIQRSFTFDVKAEVHLRKDSLEDIAAMIVRCTGAERAADIAKAILAAAELAPAAVAEAPAPEAAPEQPIEAGRAPLAPGFGRKADIGPAQRRRDAISRAYNLGLDELAKEVETDEKSYLTAERELDAHEAKQAS